MPSLISSIAVHFSLQNRNLTPKAVLQHNLNLHQGDNLDAASFNYLDSLVIKIISAYFRKLIFNLLFYDVKNRLWNKF